MRVCKVTYQTVLQAIEFLNSEAERELMSRVTTEVLVCKDPAQKFSTPMYCEDDRLSIARIGMNFRSLVLRSPVPTLSLEELYFVIDVCCAYIDFSSFVPSGPAEKKRIAMIAGRAQQDHVQDLIRRFSQSRL